MVDEALKVDDYEKTDRAAAGAHCCSVLPGAVRLQQADGRPDLFL